MKMSNKLHVVYFGYTIVYDQHANALQESKQRLAETAARTACGNSQQEGYICVLYSYNN